MPEFSANLGFLWTELNLEDRVLAAATAGFDAVECHWPYETPPETVRAALSQAGLPMLGLNTRPGDLSRGEFGLSALPGREAEARAAIDEALEYAEAIDARAVHIMAGKADGPEAECAFREALAYACDRGTGRTILIEAINRFDVPGYFLHTTQQACAILRDVGAANLKLMFDCYHVARSGSDVLGTLTEILPLVGHIQFASVPDRGPPDRGTLDYAALFEAIDGLGWSRPLGAEYKPDGATEDSLSWLARFRSPKVVSPLKKPR